MRALHSITISPAAFDFSADMSLARLVELAIALVLPQPVSEQPHPRHLRTPGPEDMEIAVHLRRLGIEAFEHAMFVPGGFTDGEVEPCRSERGDVVVFVPGVSDDEGDIDDRLRFEARHRSGPDVVDANEDSTRGERPTDPVSRLGEMIGPRGIVINDFDQSRSGGRPHPEVGVRDVVEGDDVSCGGRHRICALTAGGLLVGGASGGRLCHRRISGLLERGLLGLLRSFLGGLVR